jgi:flagellar motor switch protein FliN
VTETIEYEQFEQTGQAGAGAGSEVDLSRLSDIPMELSVEIGRTHMTVGETLDLRVGSVVALERLSGETADLLVNGTAIARGEVVVIDEQYGLRITQILDGQHDGELAAAGLASRQTRPADKGREDAGDPLDATGGGGREDPTEASAAGPAAAGPAPLADDPAGAADPVDAAGAAGAVHPAGAVDPADVIDPAVADAAGAVEDGGRAPDER